MDDTIAAIATPTGVGGIGKIRVSGPEALLVGARVFRNAKNKKLEQVKSHTIHYGSLINPETDVTIDQVVALVFKEPHSFTGENVVEFDCHGGSLVLKKVLEVILDNGVRLAEPGEFSRRAFVNGKMDLSQAESIMDIINAKTEKSLEIALDQLTGQLSAEINSLRQQVISLLAHLEAAIDFPEDEINGFSTAEIGSRIEEIKKGINKLLETSNRGKMFKEGIRTVIAGKPNVGKSSLLNYLLEEKRAIVTDVPGTTRDTIEELVNIEGIPLQIIDTAGLRATEDAVEKIGVEKTRSSLQKADLALFILDLSQGIENEDLTVYNLIKDKPLIVLVNKTDLEEKKITTEEIKKYFSGHRCIRISIKKQEGLLELKENIIEEIMKEEINSNHDILISNLRHQQALEKARQAIGNAKESYNNEMPFDFLTIDLKACLEQLGRITGETVSEDIIDQIFSDFCLGK